MKAGDIMTPKPFVVTPADDVREAAELMRYENIGGVPVGADPERPVLVGLITDRDITTRFVARGYHGVCSVGDVMTPTPLTTVPADADIGDVVKMMERAEVRRVPVVSDDGVLIGIVTEADLATRLSAKDAMPIRRRLKQYAAERHVGVYLR